MRLPSVGWRPCQADPGGWRWCGLFSARSRGPRCRAPAAARRRLAEGGSHRMAGLVLNPGRFYFDRLFFARHQFFVLGVIGDTVVNQLVGRFARGCRHDLARRGIGFDDGRRARRPRTAKNRAITEGAGGSDHRQGKDGGDGHDAHAPFRRMAILIVALFLGSQTAHGPDGTRAGRSRRVRRRMAARLALGRIVIAGGIRLARAAGRKRRGRIGRGCSAAGCGAAHSAHRNSRQGPKLAAAARQAGPAAQRRGARSGDRIRRTDRSVRSGGPVRRAGRCR